MITWIMCDNSSTFIIHLFPVCHNLRPMTWQSSTNWFSVGFSSILPTCGILWNPLWWPPVWNGEHSFYTAFPSAYYYCFVECYLFRVRAPGLTRRSLLNRRAACVCHRQFYCSFVITKLTLKVQFIYYATDITLDSFHTISCTVSTVVTLGSSGIIRNRLLWKIWG